ncbi:MAG: glucosamine-6-phosphate deaminase [Chloroflexota bacterium]|nr:glucosamine-6-phosphate deaminase [Chloroflexota bacterium]
MDLVVERDYPTLSRAAADLVTDLLMAKPDARLVVATGETPLGLYRNLADRRHGEGIDTSRLRIFQLDEYLGLTLDDSRSLYRWMREVFLEPLDIRDHQVTRLPGDAANPSAACRAYDRAVEQAGGYDLAILGLGPNGHLGFNEPPSDDDAPTRVITLTPETVHSNARYWGDEDRVPRQALTAGMKHLLAARRILLLVSGRGKREILARTLERPATPDVPASFLQLAQRVTVISDRAAMPTPPESPAGEA